MSAAAEDAFEARPPSLSVWLTALAALIAVAAIALTLPAALLGLVGLVVMVLAVYRGAHRLHTLGAMALFAGVLVAGSVGTAPKPMLVATAATVVAWDAGENGISLGKQVGSRARTRRVVLAHTGATAGVAAAVGTLGFVVYRTSRSGQPTTAVALLLLAAVLFTILLDR